MFVTNLTLVKAFRTRLHAGFTRYCVKNDTQIFYDFIKERKKKMNFKAV